MKNMSYSCTWVVIKWQDLPLCDPLNRVTVKEHDGTLNDAQITLHYH